MNYQSHYTNKATLKKIIKQALNPQEAYGRMSSEFYEVYQLQRSVSADLTENTIIGTEGNTRCRFCGKSYPEVKFNHLAHLIPQAIGNRHLLTNFECDACNHLFGKTFEDAFAKFFNVAKSLPHLREPIQANFRNSLDIPVPSFVPLFVYKTFLKIGLCLIDEHEVQDFNKYFNFLQDNSPNSDFAPNDFGKVLVTIIPGSPVFRKPVAHLFTKKQESTNLPYPEKTLLLCFSNQIYQCFLPYSNSNRINRNEITAFPDNKDFCTYTLDFSSYEKVNGNNVLALTSTTF